MIVIEKNEDSQWLKWISCVDELYGVMPHVDFYMKLRWGKPYNARIYPSTARLTAQAFREAADQIDALMEAYEARTETKKRTAA